MNALARIIRRFSKARILIVGDAILDEYIWGAVERISPEAPVPVVWANRRTFVPGGAANVAFNIASLGAQARLVGIVGGDGNAHVLLSELRKRGVDIRGVFVERSRHTTVKTRVIAGHQQIVRVDWEHTHPTAPEVNDRLIRFIRRQIAAVDALIIEDYGKGVVNPGLLEETIALARSEDKCIAVDPKEEHFQYYRGVTTITPNRKELENAVRNLKIKDTTNNFKVHTDRLKTDADIAGAARQIIQYLGLESLLVTMGEQGMRLFEGFEGDTSIPTVAQEVFDVSGAGDTVIATFALALSCGASKLQAAHIANAAAGIVVSKLGTAVTTQKELLKRV